MCPGNRGKPNLKSKLFEAVDHKLFRKLNDFIFHQVSLSSILDAYRNESDPSKDANGKRLYKRIEEELHRRKKDRGDIVEIVVEHLLEANPQDTDKIVKYLNERLSI
jgi:hypothetical protein